MPIKVFTFPFHYRGSTADILRTAAEDITGSDYSSILYLSPSPQKLLDSQQLFSKIAGGCYIPPEMHTLKQLSKKLYSVYGNKKIIAQAVIPVIVSRLSGMGLGFSAIISQFISEIKQHHSGKDLASIRSEMNGIFHELGIPDEIAARAEYALDLLKAYQQLLRSCSAIDENDVMSACPELISMHNFSHTHLLIDGFYDLTSTEEEILKHLIGNSENVLISIPYDNNFIFITKRYFSFLNNNFKYEKIQKNPLHDAPELVYHSYPGIDEEVEGIARNIKNNFVSGRMRNLEKIIVTCPVMEKYTNRISRIFRKYGIPHSLSRLKTLGETRPFLDLVAMLESVADNYPRLAFSQFLVSPFFRKLSPLFQSHIPRLCLVTGISRGKESWLKISSFLQNGNGLSSTKGIPPGLEKELGRIFSKLAPLESLKESGNCSLFSECILSLLDEFDFSSDDDADLKEKTFRLLRELSFIDIMMSHAADIPPLTLHQYIDALKHVLNTTETEIERQGVRIMAFREIQGIEPDFLYIGGLRDGELPSKPDIDHILPDSARTRFGLSNLEKYLLLQKFIYFRATASSTNIHLSYPSMEEDQIALPSPYLPWNKEIPCRCYGIFSMEEELIRKGLTPFTFYLTDISSKKSSLLKKIFGADSHIRVTDIDSFRSCPRKFFIEKILNLQPTEIRKFEIEAPLLGSIMHEIMQEVIAHPFKDLHELTFVSEETTHSLLSQKPIDEYWKRVIGKTFLALLPELYKIEKRIREEGYAFQTAEFKVAGEVIRGVKLRGKIDRIDIKRPDTAHPLHDPTRNTLLSDGPNSTVIEIIDYKTGSVQFSGPQVLSKGASLQLFLYASLMKATGKQVARAGIYSLKDMSITWIPGRNDKRDGRSINDYLEMSLRFLSETVEQLRNGYFPADPLNEQICRNCPERPYCPFIQKSA